MGPAPDLPSEHDLPLYSLYEEQSGPLLPTPEPSQAEAEPTSDEDRSPPSSCSTLPRRELSGYSLSLVFGPERPTRPSHLALRIHGEILTFHILASLCLLWVIRTLSSQLTITPVEQGKKKLFCIVLRLKAIVGLIGVGLRRINVCERVERRGIDRAEFGVRRDTLASLLSGNHDWGVWVSEPGPNTLYYVNLSASDWSLSERPWLVVITPLAPRSTSTSNSKAHLSILTPSFELSRSKRLPFALCPTDIFRHLLGDLGKKQVVTDGIGEALKRVKGRGLEVKVGLVGELIREQRMRKTRRERDLLRCVSKVTMHALRKVQKHLRVGMTEKQGEALISNALTSAGLTDLSIIVLFGPNGAIPHASASENKRLEPGEFALFDVVGGGGGGTFKGYVLLPNDMGNGIGLQGHEAPYLNAGNKGTMMKEGEVFSIEPGGLC
ncbi:BQ2448_5482 [Microbotryum intermedium]|uniref:BQ2448_5482 protein n=1 Tax=Microbotryum intermedium TaxID=269621 RepID=A0A238F714_9BASI|nr:BQ2448_5482 [Microbotryum intermedium]